MDIMYSDSKNCKDIAKALVSRWKIDKVNIHILGEIFNIHPIYTESHLIEELTCDLYDIIQPRTEHAKS